MSKDMNPFHQIDKQDKNTQTNNDPSVVRKTHLPRGSRHAIQIDKKFYFTFRKLAFRFPGTNITQWADRALAYSFKNGPIKEWIKKSNE